MHYRKIFKSSSIIILRLVLTVAADRLNVDKDLASVSAVNCYPDVIGFCDAVRPV